MDGATLGFSAIFAGGFVLVIGVILAVSCCLLTKRHKKRAIKQAAGDLRDALDAEISAMPWPDLVPDNQAGQSPDSDGPPPPLPMSVMLAAYSCHEQIKSHQAASDEIALLCLQTAIDATLAGAEGTPREDLMHPGLVEAMHAFGGTAGGDEAQVRAQLELLRRSVHTHLGAARLAKLRAASGDKAVCWSDASSLERHPSRRPGAKQVSRRGERRLDEGSSVACAKPSSLPAPSKAIAKAAETLFNRHDKDGSGSIDANELRLLCSEFGKDLSPHQLALALKTLDKSGEGLIDRDEFLWWYGLGLSVAALTDPKEQERLQANRAAGIGRMAEEQGRAMQSEPTAEDIQAIFNQFDKDQSGCLSIKEVSSAMRRIGYAAAGLTTSEALHMFDDSQTGDLSLDEFTELVHAVHEEMSQLSEPLGKNRVAALMQQERDEMRATDDMPDGNDGDSAKARGKKPLQIKGRTPACDAASSRSGDKERPGRLNIRGSAKLGSSSLLTNEPSKSMATLHRVAVSTMPKPSKAIQKLAHTMFARHDIDGSGLIDQDELGALCSKLGKNLSPTQLALAMKTLDKSGEGMVDEEEFLWWYALGLSVAALTDPEEQARLQERRAAGLTQMDDLRNQADNTAPTPERIQAAFAKYDKDGSGGLCVAEIGHAVRFMGLGNAGKASELIGRAEHAHEKDDHLDYAEFERLALAIHHEQVQHGGAGLTGKEQLLQTERDEMLETDQILAEAKRAPLQIKGRPACGATSTRSGHKERAESTRGIRGGGTTFVQGKIDVAACRPAAPKSSGAGSSTEGAAPKKHRTGLVSTRPLPKPGQGKGGAPPTSSPLPSPRATGPVEQSV